MRIAEELGADVETVNYIKDPPDADTLRAIIAKLEDPPTDLVRRDSLFKKLELTDADVESVDQIVDVLVANKRLLQRPVLVTVDTAIIGRMVMLYGSPIAGNRCGFHAIAGGAWCRSVCSRRAGGQARDRKGGYRGESPRGL